MIIRTNISALLALVSLIVSFSLQTDQAFAADCLSSQETRQAIEDGRAKHLAAIKEATRKVVRGDVIKADLCHGGEGLVYQLVTLSRQGAVSRLVLDAKSGKIISKGGG